jgi:two-component system, NtrC family, nitrogen regulation sensor histidine kinase NtrY
MLRVFNNLLKNSIQAINEIENGKVDIEITRHENTIAIKVADNGTGISKEESERIFSPNFTTKTGGMGLGLAMVKNIVESYNGTIRFESEKNKGTTFFVELPANENTEEV